MAEPRDYHVVCSRCGRTISGRPTAEQVSHGICPTCKAKLIDDLGLEE